jgi:peptide/nickel transport system permease protein
MTKYAIQRLLLALPTVLLLTVLIFGAVRVIPGDVCTLLLSTGGGATTASEEECDELNHVLGLDRPAYTQYFDWLGGVLHGDLGASLFSHYPVGLQLKNRMAVTIELALLAASLSLLIGMPMGVISAIKQNGPLDYGLRLAAVGWLSMPSFWVATLLITFPAKWWSYAPPVGYASIWSDPLKNIEQMYLPAIAVGLSISAAMARLTRSTMLGVLRDDFVRTARAKGLSERTVLYRHALRTAMLPIVTLFGLQITFLLSGSLVVEFIFALPGVGSYLLSGVLQKDFPVIQGGVLFFGVIVVLMNIIVDVSYSWLDPRIRRG